jgi:hypothetical protein
MEMNEVRVRIEDQAQTFNGRFVWVLGRRGDDTFIWRNPTSDQFGGWIQIESPNVAIPSDLDSSFRATDQILQAIAVRVLGSEPPPRALETVLREAVKDAREVRDKLLQRFLTQELSTPLEAHMGYVNSPEEERLRGELADTKALVAEVIDNVEVMDSTGAWRIGGDYLKNKLRAAAGRF